MYENSEQNCIERYSDTIKESITTLLGDLPPKELETIAETFILYAEEKKYRNNETVADIGDPANYLYLILDGSVKSVNYTSAGEEISFYYFTSGNFLCLLHVLIQENMYSRHMSAGTSTILCLPAKRFLMLLDDCPAFTKQLLFYVSKQSCDLVQLIIVSRRKKTRDRICSYLITHYVKTGNEELQVPFSIDFLAKRLNLTRSALSKGLHSLEKEGMIRIDKNSIILENFNLLEESLF